MPNRIQRVTLFPVRVPIAFEKINCPEFPETLNRGPDGQWGGQWFGDAPFHVIKVEGDGGPAGWGDTTRVVKFDDLERGARVLRGLAEDAVGIGDRSLILAHAQQSLGPDSPTPTPDPAWKGLETAVLDWAARCRGVPLHSLFGHKVRDGVRIEYWSGFRTPAGATGVARKAKAAGFLGLKLKAHKGIDAPGIARAVLKACGPEFHLTIDIDEGAIEKYRCGDPVVIQ